MVEQSHTTLPKKVMSMDEASDAVWRARVPVSRHYDSTRSPGRHAGNIARRIAVTGKNKPNEIQPSFLVSRLFVLALSID